MQDAKSAYEAEIHERLKAMTFPSQDLPEQFRSWATQALLSESKVTLAVDQATFKRLHGYVEDAVPAPITLYDMGYLLNAMERRTRREWFSDDYHEAMEAQDQLAAKWNEIVEPIKKAIIDKLSAQARISQGVPAHKKIISPGGKR